MQACQTRDGYPRCQRLFLSPDHWSDQAALVTAHALCSASDTIALPLVGVVDG